MYACVFVRVLCVCTRVRVHTCACAHAVVVMECKEMGVYEDWIKG